MKIQLYIKPSIVGLHFASQSDRDTFWTILGEQQNCAERFGERTIRLHPAKATASFRIPLEAETVRVIVDSPQAQPKLSELPKVTKPLPNETMVIPAAPTPIAPIAIIPAEPTTPGTVTTSIPDQQFPPPEPPPTIPMPQIASVTAPAPKLDGRSKEARALRAQAA